MTVVLGIDLATAEARVQAIDEETGAALAERRQPLPLIGAAAGRRLQPAVHGRVALELVAAVASDLGARACEVRALSVTGTSGTVVPVDTAGLPVGDAVLYDDPRGADELKRLTDAGFDGRPRGALARAAWMHADAKGGGRTATSIRYVFTPDLVGAALTGRLLPSDTSHGLKSGIDPVTGRWNEGALDVLGLPTECVPELVPPGRVIGEVMAPVANKLGLPAGVLIVSGMTDGATAQVATGAVALGDTVGVLGTTLVLKAVSSTDVVDNPSGVYSHVAPDGLFWPGGASNTGAGVLRDGATAGLEPVDAAAAVAACGAAHTVAYPLPRPGERFPVADPAFAGFDLPFPRESPASSRHPSNAVARFRAVYEGVAFVERLGLERLASLGVERKKHHLAGGASVSGVWNHIRASALGRPVIVVEGAGSARGAATLAAVAWSGRSLAVVAEKFAGPRHIVDPDSALVGPLEERYFAFLEALMQHTTSPLSSMSFESKGTSSW